MKPDILNLYLSFLAKREEAREAKELGIIPHSDDPIISRFSFCNINREHDRVTRWVKATVRDNKRIQNSTAMVVKIAVARIFNDPATFEGLAEPWGIEEVREHVVKRQAEGKRVFRGAYMMPSHGSKDQLKMPPALYYLDAARQLAGLNFSGAKTLEEACNLVLSVHGFGPFLANQIVTDLRYTKWWAKAPDWETFVLGGPGTSRGLCRLYGEPLKIDKPQPWIKERLLAVREHVNDMKLWPFTDYFLDPNNVSNSFCEFDKYARALADEGRINRLYKAR